MRFRPCIDLHAGIVKQIVGSTLTDDSIPLTNFQSQYSASYYAKKYKEHGLKGGHIIMLGSHEENQSDVLDALQCYPNGMQVGGGITPHNAQIYLDKGASHVIVTSYVFRNGTIDFERLDELCKKVGKEHLVLDLSCRKKKDSNLFYVMTDRWQNYTDFPLTLENIQLLSTYCSEFLVHAVDVEGMRCGVQEELVILLAQYSPIPVTYAGGSKSINDLDLVKDIGNGRVDLSIGSALDLFGGDISFEAVVQWQLRNKE